MSDCVPYAIHIATGEDLCAVLSLAAQRGWDSEKGWSSIGGWCLLRDMGFQITSMKKPESPVILKQFLPTLDEGKTSSVSDITGSQFVAGGVSIRQTRIREQRCLRLLRCKHPASMVSSLLSAYGRSTADQCAIQRLYALMLDALLLFNVLIDQEISKRDIEGIFAQTLKIGCRESDFP